MKTFEVNGKKYNAKPFDFNMICDFEDNGLPMSSLTRKPTAAIRAYFAICGNMDAETAGKEISEHMIKGGNLDEISIAMNEEMENSDFFRAITKTAEEEAGADKGKKK